MEATGWFLEVWWRAMSSVSVQAGILILGVVGVNAACRLSARTRCQLWCLVLLRLVVPVPIETPIGLLPVSASEPIWRPAAFVAMATPAMRPGTEADSTHATQATPPGRVTGNVMLRISFALWLIGFLTLLFLRLWRQAALRRWLAGCQLPAPALEDWVADLWATIEGRGGVRLRIADDAGPVRGPVLVGVWRPTVVLPAAMAAGWSRPRLEPVILHELLHARRRDAQWNALLSWVETVYFFHPLVWLAAARLRREREYACDDEVVARRASTRQQYIDALVQLAVRPADKALAASLTLSRRSQLLPRIRRLLEPGTPPPAVRLRFVLGALAVTVILLLAAGRTQPIMADVTAVVDEQAQRLIAMAEDPDPALAQLATYATRCDPEGVQLRAELLVDVTTRRPDLDPEGDGAMYLVAFSPDDEPALYQRLRTLWEGHLVAFPDNLAVFANAAAFFEMREPARALDLFSAIEARQPGRRDVALRLGALYVRLAPAGSGTTPGLRRAVDAYRADAERSNDATMRLLALTEASRRLTTYGAVVQGADFARQALALADQVPDQAVRPTSIHFSRIVLGHEALANGDEDAAVRLLLRSLEEGGSPVLSSFGPDLKLADALLQRGRRQVVVDYLSQCRDLWPRREDVLGQWIEAIHQQQTPRLDPRRTS